MTPLAAALGYAKRGLGVLPIEPRGKVPIGALVPHGVKDASADAATIRGWWARVPAANVAIAVRPEWFVFDVDPRNGGAEELARLEREHGALPPTITARTGSGGEHRLFARPAGVKLRGKLGPGIDLLGVGRYFLAAPSVHPCGGAYRWTSAKGTAIAQPPRWLVELARAVEAPAVAPSRPIAPTSADVVERARKYLARCEPAISGSGGHTTTFLVAQKLVRGFELDEGTALALLAEWNTNCKPPWSKRDLARKIKEAARSGSMPVGALRDARRSA